MSKLQEVFMLSDKGYRDLKKAIFACTLTNFSLMIPFTVTILIFMEIIKPFLNEDISWTKLWLIFGAGIVGALIVFLAYRNDYEKTYIASYIEAKNTRVNIAEQIRKLPMSVFNSKDLSELTTSIMSDVAIIEHVLSHILPQLIANAISITIICGFLSFYDYRMALAVFASVPIAFLIIFLSKKLQRKLGKNHDKAKLDVSDKVQEYLDGIKVIKACNMSGEKFAVLKNAMKKMKSLAIKFELVTGTFVSGSQVILQSGIGITILVGIQLYTSNQIELIPLLMFLLLVTKIYGPILVELTLLPELFYHQIAIKRLKKLMEINIMEGKEVDLLDYEIKFNKVGFSYNENEDKTTISDFNTTIAANAITALVGPSGSGKSTISKLIARFWDVNQGSITIGNVNIKEIDPEYLMKHMSFLFQDVILFNDTILNNIKIGNLAASDEEVREIAKLAHCHEFIMKLPEGYNTILGENGSTLSGGERQRISIARALLKNAPIVLLDEATSSIDPENEHLIQEAISRLIQDKTVIVIAHKLRTIENVDKIIVLEEGKIVEEGNHEQLMNNKNLYEKLYTLQKESIEWSVV